MAKDIPVESIDQMMDLAREYFPGVEVQPPLDKIVPGEGYVVVYAYYPPQYPNITSNLYKRSIYAKRHATQLMAKLGTPLFVRPGTYNYL